MRTPRFALVTTFLLPFVLAAAPAYQDLTRREATPFPIGEQLVYGVRWDPPWYFFFLPTMDAGEVNLKLEGETEYHNKKALKILLLAQSSGALARMAGMKIEDEFVFYTEPKTLCALGVSRKIREGKRKRHIEVEYLRETNQLHILEIDESVTPPKVKKDEIKDNVPSCIQDPLSALYSFRTSQLRVAHLQTFVIGYDDRIKEVSSRVEKQEIIETPVGKFPAWKVTTISLMGGLFKEGGQFRIWFSADEKKIPLQFEIKVRLGKVLGKLEQVKY